MKCLDRAKELSPMGDKQDITPKNTFVWSSTPNSYELRESIYGGDPDLEEKMGSPSQPICPSCKEKLDAANQSGEGAIFAPFCSKRCKDIDLGRWLVEDYRIPAPLDPEEEL